MKENKVAPIIKAINKKKENNMNITQEQFKSYVNVQESGVTNMFDVRTVSLHSGLDKQEITYIMGHYSELLEKNWNDGN